MLSVDARVIITARLVMRPHAAADHPDCAALWADPGVMRFIGSGAPLSDEEAWNRLLRYAGCWQLFGYGYWAVRDRANGRFVGDVGFQNLRRAAVPALPDRPETGWVLAAAAHGRGFGREAVAAALAWADRHIAAPETLCIVRAEHERSMRIAAENGYARTGTVLLHGQPIELFTRPIRGGKPVAAS